ncbi:MAG: AMP-dependent synthetase, partial [Conexibacter sp.]|nr:AMP-dependent synthetase [Conexibacter sp.]
MSNAAQAAWDHATADPDRIALRGAGEPWSYGTLRERAAAVAGALRAAGIAP